MNDRQNIIIGGAIELRDLLMISIFAIPDQPGSAGQVLSYFGQNGISVDFITESSNQEGAADITFCIHSSHKPRITQFFSDLKSITQAKQSRIMDNVAIISYYGPHFREKPAIAGQICQTLGRAGINILAISTSISSVSCVIADAQIEAARIAISNNFEFPK